MLPVRNDRMTERIKRFTTLLCVSFYYICIYLGYSIFCSNDYTIRMMLEKRCRATAGRAGWIEAGRYSVSFLRTGNDHETTAGFEDGPKAHCDGETFPVFDLFECKTVVVDGFVLELNKAGS